jgi:hypothetical protein
MRAHLSSPPNQALALTIATALLLAAWAAPRSALAQAVVSGSPDITIGLDGGTVVTSDEDVAVDNSSFVLLENLGALPEASDVIALGGNASGDRLIALDITSSLPGGIIASPGDVIRYDGANYSIEFDASAEGVPAGARTDAASIAPGGLLLSFDTTVDLDGVIAADEDLVRWDGAAFTLVFDGSAEGLADGLDADAGQDLGSGAFLISFDTSGQIGGVNFDDEDVLRFDGSAWTLEFDASGAHATWAAADLDAVMVPEPGFGGLVVTGALWLGLAGRRR